MFRRRTDVKTIKNSEELRQMPTEAELKLWPILRSHRLNNIHFRRQHAIGPYIVDFCAPRQKLIIELDGGQHMDHQGYDIKRTEYLKQKGYRVIRFWNHEVIKDFEGVVQAILDAVNQV